MQTDSATEKGCLDIRSEVPVVLNNTTEEIASCSYGMYEQELEKTTAKKG